ncbi:VCBS repeat-containing protein [Actinoplanes sp. NPDC049265]|uniref:VCBS repeat-containing protein n=1 Tax=Actinoplanes sp. NPDC049265 TaxID=3363902 RepID=UPI00371FEB22
MRKILTTALTAAAALAVTATPAHAARTDDPIPFNALIAYNQCVAGGPTAADNALANQLRPQMNGSRLGRAITGYNVSCARIIAGTVRGRGLDPRAAVIAVTTAITESTLHNYTEAVDHDSLGLFQQRPSQGWGTPAQLIDPVYATNAFVNAMLRKYPNNGWMSGDIGAICQRVQVSAVPDAYAKEVHDAQLLVNALWGGAPNLGVFEFHLSDSLSSSTATRPAFAYGNSPMTPIRGDWNGDGSDTVSTFDKASAKFLISDDPTNGQAQRVVMFGNPGEGTPFVGDWNGDGKDNIGTRMGNTFFLRTTEVTDGAEAATSIAFGDATDQPIAGDWDGDGTDEIGVYRPSTGQFFLRAADGSAVTVAYGDANAVPLVGDWNHDGKDNIGVRMGNTYFFRTSEITDPAEITSSVAYGNGDGNEIPLTGDWNGDGTDTQGIVF